MLARTKKKSSCPAERVVEVVEGGRRGRNQRIMWFPRGVGSARPARAIDHTAAKIMAKNGVSLSRWYKVQVQESPVNNPQGHHHTKFDDRKSLFGQDHRLRYGWILINTDLRSDYANSRCYERRTCCSTFI